MRLAPKKTFLIAAACCALAACGANDATSADGAAQAATSQADPQSPNRLAAAAMAGEYEVSGEDGTIVLQTLNADGTYVETVDGVTLERGTWYQRGDQMCYDPEGDAIEQCYTGGLPGRDGSVSVEMDGGTASVRRVDKAKGEQTAEAQADAR